MKLINRMAFLMGRKIVGRDVTDEKITTCTAYKFLGKIYVKEFKELGL